MCSGLAGEGILDAEKLDVLIVGSGLSGIGAACHIKKAFPERSFAVLEARDSTGGTWDLFRYPGIRSDSDMFTLGYAFKPWRESKAIADGPSILRYVRETAAETGVDAMIRLHHRVVSAEWSSTEARWLVTAEAGEAREIKRFSCAFVMMCSGYYRYEHGYEPQFEGRDRFRGRIIHPQLWPADLDYTGKQVVVIGSGATAVTIVPEMAKTAGHVTMLQRSPTYVVSRPAEDKVANWLRRRLPAKMAYGLIRWKNILLGMYFFNRARTQPEKVKTAIIDLARRDLGPDIDVATHFTPRYNPWDQRLCLVPDSDLFKSLREKRASVVTDTIDTFTETGIQLASGKMLPADIIVTATGLDLLFLGGVSITVDGKPFAPATALTYKGMMYEGVPNLISVFGYTNASWTLKCDLTCEYTVRLLRHMDRTGRRQVTPKRRDNALTPEPWLDFSSGYVQRSLDHFPKQGARKPWRLNQNYVADIMLLRHGSLDDPELEFI